jgi:hypothetical protein
MENSPFNRPFGTQGCPTGSQRSNAGLFLVSSLRDEGAQILVALGETPATTLNRYEC